jgi:HNH endonuclease
MSVYVGVGLQRQIRTHFSNCCAYCHTSEALTVAIFEFEHIAPRSVGGETIFENLCLACPTCNRYKANRQNALDPITGELVPLFHPHLQVWKDHFAWDENATELTGFTPTGRATISALKMNRSQLIRVRRMWFKLGEHPPGFE